MHIGYTKTTPDKIGKTLKDLFSSVAEKGAEFVISAGKNLIILIPSKKELATIDPIVEHFTRVYPARFFVVYLDAALSEIEVALSVKCHILSKDEHACSEVILIGAPQDQVSNLQSILRANALPGRTSELFVHNLGQVGLKSIELIASLCDKIIVDSSEPNIGISLISRIQPLTKQLVDLEWIRLGLYRDQISSVFRRAFISSILNQISEVELQATSNSNAMPNCLLLLAGWLLEGLHLNVMTYSSEGFECRAASDAHVLLRVKVVASKDQAKVTGVNFSFRDKLGSKIALQRSNVLEVVGATGTGFRLKRALDDDSLIGCINRYFLIGESVSNYESALKNALELQNLSAGFLVD